MTDDLSEPWVYLSTIPELETILRRGLLSKVRIFEAWCEKGDRLAQVIRVGGRPLALTGRLLGPMGIMQAGAPSRTKLWARVPRHGMWLDMNPGLYYVPTEPPTPDASSWEVHPLRISGQCQHENVSIPTDWLRTQVEKDVRKRVIGAAARREMGV